MKALMYFVIISLLKFTARVFGNESLYSNHTSLNYRSDNLQTKYHSNDSLETPIMKSHGRLFKLEGDFRKYFAYEVLIEDSATNNVVCSPISALLPLGKLALGAEGKSRLELEYIMGISWSKDTGAVFKSLIKDLRNTPGVQLDLASRLYVSNESKLYRDFEEESKKVFHSAVEKVNFKNKRQTADEINGWVSRQTNGKIPLILSPSSISPKSSLILINAVYFRGKWKEPFKKTKFDLFLSPKGNKRVKMMSRRGFYDYVKSDYLKAQIIRIPYQGSESSFIIVLPDNTKGLANVLQKIKQSTYYMKAELNQMKITSVTLDLPKFTITTKLNLKDIYKKVGLKYVFSDTRTGLTRIVQDEELWVTKAVQKAVIDVYETGTDAAAASAVEIQPVVLEMSEVRFRANHPFLFYVEVKGEQLFAGTYNGPEV